MYRSNRRKWSKAVITYVLSCSCFVATCLHAGPNPERVTVSWEHDAGPYSYSVYEITNLNGPQAWMLKTNVSDLSVQFTIEAGEHFFTVTCVDTNTGLESPPFATP